MPTAPNPGLSQLVQEAMARRQQGQPQGALTQTSPGAAMATPNPQPMPMSEMTQASAPQGGPAGQPPQLPKFEPQDRTDLITLALIEQMKNDNKLQKEKTKLAEVAPAAPVAPTPPPAPLPMGGGFSMSPGFEQPLAVSQMQSNYPMKDYSGLNNYGKGGM